MAKTEFTLDYPLVDDNFNSLPEAEDFIKSTSDEFENYNVKIMVPDETMVSTAMFFSMRKRHNVNFTVHLGNFKGSNFVRSFLLSGHVKEVICE